ncbi:MAG TPA: hypothetical protein VFT18_06535 [Gaiellaceae bacterium]|nr:hypothetical protein [Gaiellaceae bacterium]
MKKLVLGALAAMSLAAVAPAVAQAPQVNLAISRVGGGPQGTTTTVKYGELVRLSGELANGQANQIVELTVSPYRGETRIVTLQTDSTGEFRWAHRPTIRTGYTARWNNQASSQEPYAHVRPKVGLRVLNARLGRFRVTMMAQPEHVSRVVWFQRRLRNNRWANVKKVQLPARNLSARFTARLPRGTQRVRIFVPATPGYLRATSSFVRVTR